MRIAAIGVSHWHALYDAAYLHRLTHLPDVQLVGLHDANSQIAAQRSAAVGNPPIFTDYARMLDETHPDFVLALGDHRAMATTAHYLLDHGYPFLMEKPMGYNAAQGTETLPSTTPEPPYMLILRQTLEHWQRGAPPPVSVHDCYRAVQLIDQAYEMAGQPYGAEHR